MRKSKNKFYRWIAMMLTAALLVGQCQAPVLANEGTAPVEMGISGENKDGAQEGGSGAADEDAPKDGKEGTENGGGEGGAGNGGTGEDGDGADNSGTEEGDTGNGGDGAGSDNGEGGDGSGSENGGAGGDEGENQGATDKCVCETACTEDAVNEECPVCAADYAACAQNAGEGVDPSEGIGEDESVSGNELAGEANAALMAVDEGVETRLFENEFIVEDIKYRDLKSQYENVATVIGHKNGTEVSGNIKIPASVENNGVKYSVWSITESAFKNCRYLSGIEIEEGVYIGRGVFWGCRSLNRIEIPKCNNDVGSYTFWMCTSLADVKIPDNVKEIGVSAFFSCASLTNVEIPDSVTRIWNGAFSGCGLTSVEIPKGMTEIEAITFAGCSDLTRVTITENISRIDFGAFSKCKKLNDLRIVILSDGKIQFPTIGTDEDPTLHTFYELPDKRYIRFVDESGKKITGDVFANAEAAFTEAAKNDDDGDDTKWYGWSLGDPLDGNDTYTVTINVKKDGTPWRDHGRTFALLGGGDSGFLEVPGQTADSSYTISQVPDGTYRIYDITGVPADSLYSRARDTGAEVRVSGADTEVDVTVNGADVEKDVHYYTATFYDGVEAYKAGTPQEPQIILSGKKAAKPEDPQKADWQFAGWKTTDGGSTSYDFDTPVTDITSIFASWVEKTAEQLHITADATEGGTIDPTGDIVVTKGGEQSFTITPNEGYKIKTVTVDGKDVTAGLKDTLARAQVGARYYTFTNVTEDHTIHAAFEADSGDKPGEGDDNPGDDDKPGDDDNPGDDDKPDDDGGKPGGGGDKPDPGDDTPDDGGDNPAPDGDTPGGETVQVTVVSQTSSPQALDGAGSSEGAPDTSAAERTANGREPKTGDADYVEIYATLAMIAGLTYLLLYFMEESRGMTEREKEVFVAAFIRWAKKGGRFRRCCAVAAIFCLLVYYHSIGKRAGRAGFDRECLRQAL